MPAILSAHKGNDTGGTGWRLSQAFDQHGGDWTFRSSCNPHAVLPYLDYPQDLPWDWTLLKQLETEADVFQARNDFATYDRLGSRLPLAILYHGTNFRILNGHRLREQRRHQAIGLVSTLDLWLIEPEELEWLPSAYDLEFLQRLAADG